jgi:hypothetical protein
VGVSAAADAPGKKRHPHAAHLAHSDRPQLKRQLAPNCPHRDERVAQLREDYAPATEAAHPRLLRVKLVVGEPQLLHRVGHATASAREQHERGPHHRPAAARQGSSDSAVDLCRRHEIDHADTVTLAARALVGSTALPRFKLCTR